VDLECVFELATLGVEQPARGRDAAQQGEGGPVVRLESRPHRPVHPPPAGIRARAGERGADTALLPAIGYQHAEFH
jgi:hypothetical protein